MALRVQLGNRPVLDDDGFAHGVLKSITEVEPTKERDWESVEWMFESSGTQRPYAFRIWTGLTLNPPDDKGDMNKLTLVCVRLGVVDLHALEQGDEPELDLESLPGLVVRYKLVREKGLYRIDVPTMELDTNED